MKLLRWGMVGCGAVTETKSGPAFDRVPGSRLVAVASRSPDRARDWAARHGTPRWHADPGALLADPELNAVYVATPPDAHAEWAIRAAHAGKAVILVEKPLARSSAEARGIVDACRAAGARLYCAYYRRALPAFLQVKRWIDRGAIGRPRVVALDLRRPARPEESGPTPPWRVRPEVGGGGAFADMAPHQFDFLDFVLGPVRDPRGAARNTAGLYDAEDTVDAAWSHDGGVQAAGHWSFVCAPADERETAVIAGDLGRIEFSFFNLVPGIVRLVTARGVESFAPPAQPHVHEPLVRSIVEDWRGRAPCPATGDAALRTDAVLDTILGR